MPSVGRKHPPRLPTQGERKPHRETTQYEYTDADRQLDNEITAAEQRLDAMYTKRARRHIVANWFWCACGRDKCLRVGAAINETTCNRTNCGKAEEE